MTRSGRTSTGRSMRPHHEAPEAPGNLPSSGDQALKLTVNGEPRDVAATTVHDLLEELGLKPVATVVERNAEIVDRASYRDTLLADGDILELVRLVGGG
jgi:sulfur carrier protein